MNVIYSNHARTQMGERGVSEEEVIEVLGSGSLVQARGGRQIKVKVLTRGYRWRGVDHPHKEIQVIHVEEQGAIIVITVKSRYGTWEGTT